MSNSNLYKAKQAKNDEFYTEYKDIEEEMSFYNWKEIFENKTILCPCDKYKVSNFTNFFLNNQDQMKYKSLISSHYDPKEPPKIAFDKNYLCPKDENFTGDFRSDEVSTLKELADIVITNPPFSLFREFFDWVKDKQFLIIGNLNAVTYKEIFPYIQSNKVWIGASGIKGRSYYNPETKAKKKFGNTCWFTNIDYLKRHSNLPVEKTEAILKTNKKIQALGGFRKYDNYDAIEIPETKAIPSDYNGIMGVPISFIDKHCPEQFDIVWQASGNTRASAPKEVLETLGYIKHPEDRGGCAVLDGKRLYGRIFIKKR